MKYHPCYNEKFFHLFYSQYVDVSARITNQFRSVDRPLEGPLDRLDPPVHPLLY